MRVTELLRKKTALAFFVLGCLLTFTPAARADYYDFKVAAARALWTVKAGTWSGDTVYGYRCAATGGVIQASVAVTVTNGSVIALSCSKASAGDSPSVTVSYFEEGDATETILGSEVFSGVATYNSFLTFTHRLSAQLVNKRVVVKIAITGLASGQGYLASAFVGQAMGYNAVWPCNQDSDITNGWYYSGTVVWSGLSNSCYEAATKNSGSTGRGLLKTRYQLPAPTNDNVVVSFDIYNEPNEGVKPNDYIQVCAHTNSWINESTTRFDIGTAVPRWDASAAVGANAWRRETVSRYIPGISNKRTFLLGFEAVPGGSSTKNLKIRNIEVGFMTSVSPVKLSWTDGTATTGNVESNDLKIGDTYIPEYQVEFRPEEDVSVKRTVFYRVALNRGANETQSEADSIRSNSNVRVFWNSTNRIDAVEAGETNLFRAVCEYKSLSGLPTNSPAIYPKHGGWITNVVGGIGGVWINEAGTDWVEIASCAGRSMSANWRVLVSQGGAAFVTNVLGANTFADNCHGLGFLYVSPVSGIGAQGHIKLLNAAGIVEFESDYNLSGGASWGATGIGPDMPTNANWTSYWTNFVYRAITNATHGTINQDQYKETVVVMDVIAQAGVLGMNSNTVIPNARLTATPLFSNPAFNRSVDGVTRKDGWTTNMVFVGEHKSSLTSQVQIAVSVFGYWADTLIADASLSEGGGAVYTNRYRLDCSASCAYDYFNDFAAYWSEMQLSGGVVDWRFSDTDKSVYAYTRNVGTLDSSAVLYAGNGLQPRSKRSVRVSLTTYNNYNSTRSTYNRGVPLLSDSTNWLNAAIAEFPVYSNRYLHLPNSDTTLVSYAAVLCPQPELLTNSLYFGVKGIAGGNSTFTDLYLDNVRVAFQDMLLGKHLSVRQHAQDITKPILFDVYADVEAWGANITRVIPSLVCRKTGAATWTTNSLVRYLHWSQVTGAWAGTNGADVITITNNAMLVATNLPSALANLSYKDTMEYYLLLQYDPDDADPSRYGENGSLVTPEVRYYPDNSSMISNAWTCIAKTYAYATLTNTVNGISEVWINEVSRNLNADAADDFVELVGATNTSLTGWTVEVQDLANLGASPAVTTISGTLTVGATNGYAFYVLGGASISPRQQNLTAGLPEQCGVTLKDSAGNIRYRLAFNGSAAGYETAVATDAASWSACGKGNPAYYQYAWTGSENRTFGSVNNTVPPQELEPGGPVGLGVTNMVAVEDSTDRLSITVSGATDPDGVATGRLYVVQGNITNAVFGFSGTNSATFVVSNLSENVKYKGIVVYTDTVGKEGDTAPGYCYTLLATPAAPTLARRTPNTITVAASIANLAADDTRVEFFGPSEPSGWVTNEWQFTKLSTNTLYGFSAKGRNGDGFETALSATNFFYTLANRPDAGVLLMSSALNGSLTVCVTNLTSGGAGAFGNPAYTLYMLLHSNAVSGAEGYVTTNGLAAQTAGLSALKADAAWMPIGAWNDVAVFGLALTNDFRLVARSEDGAETLSGPAAQGVVSMQVSLQTASQVAGVPQELAFSGSFMNPAAAVTTNELALQFSTDGGATWSKATIKSGSVTLGVGSSPAVDNGQAYPIRDVATADYTNRIAEGRWAITNDLAAGSDYAVRLRLACSNAFSGAVSPATTNVSIDLSAPSAALSGAPSGYTSATACSVTVGGADVVAYKWRLERSPSYGVAPDWSDILSGDGWSSETAAATPIVRSGLEDGCYRLSAIGRDAAGNWQAAAGATQAVWSVDTVAPTAMIVTAPPSLTTNATVIFELAADPPTNAVAWTYAVFKDTGALVGATNSASTNVFSVTVPDDGDYAIRIWARDQAGNVQAQGAPTVCGWTLDRMPPVAVLFGTPAAYSADAALNVTVTNAASPGATNTVTHYRWKLERDGTTVADWSAETAVATKITAGLTQDGAYTLSVIGRDLAGNWQAVPGTVANWVRDTAAASAWFAIPPALNNGYLNTNRLSFSFGTWGATNAADWTFSVTPGVTNVSSWTAVPAHTVTIATNGVYVLSAWARDAAGNVSVSATTVAVRVDTAAPAAGEVALGVTPAVAPNGLSNQTNFTFQVTVALPALFGGGTDTGATYRCQFNNGPTGGVTAVNTSTTVVSATGGAVTNTFRVWAADWLGNAQAVATNFTWVVDTQAPVAVLQGVPGAYSTNSALNVTVSSAAEAGDLNAVTSYRWKLERDGTTVADWSSETAVSAKITQSLTQDGAYTLSVIGRDLAGNWQAVPGTVANWVRDTAAASAWFAIPPALNNGYLNTNKLSFSFGTWGATNAADWTFSVTPGVTNVSSWTAVPAHTVTIATNGVYALSAWARDAAGNVSASATTVVVRVDTTAPAAGEVALGVTPAVAPNGLSNQTNFTFQVTVALPALFGGGTDTGATYRCQFNNGPTSGVMAVNTSTTVVSATGGAVTNTFRVWAADWLGNAQTVATNFIWVVDTEAPAAAFKVEPWATDGTWQTNQSWNVTVTGDTQVVAYKWQLDNGTVSAETAINAATFMVSGLSETNHTVKVWGRDTAGNWQTNPTVYSRIVDVTAPTALLMNVPPTNTTQTWAQVSVTNASGAAYQDIIVRYRWQLAGPHSAEGEAGVYSNIVLQALQDGVYTLSVWGYDHAGNRQTLATTAGWTVDTVAPAAAFRVSPPANGKWMTNAVWTVDVTGGVDVAAFRWTVDNAVMPTTGETSVSGFPTRVFTDSLPQKECTLYVWGRDVAGNWQTNAATFTKTVDTLVPADVIITNTPPILSNSSNWTFRVVSNDVVRYQWKLDGGSYSGETAVGQDFEVKGLADGSHTVWVLGRDEAGNWNPAAASFTWTVDVTPPATVTIGNRPVADGGRTNAISWSFAVGGTDVAAYRWTTNVAVRPLSGDTPVATPLAVDGLSDGTYALRVWGRDAAGNWLETPALYTWTVDTQAPVARFQVSPVDNGGWQTNSTWTVTVTGDTQVVAYQWQLDGGAFSAEIPTNAATFTLSNLSESNHTVRVKGRDTAGNWQTLNVQEYSAIVDTVRPVAVLTNVPAYYTRTNAISVVVTNAAGAEERDRIAVYRWRLTRDGNTVSDWTGTNTPATIQAALALDGIYELSVVGRDPAGNWQQTPGTVTNWVRDTLAPVAWFEKGIPPLTNSPTVSFRVGSTGSLDSVQWRFEVWRGTCVSSNGWDSARDYTVDLAGRGDSTYTNLVWGRDAAGNVQTQPTTNIWTLDTTPPSVSEIAITNTPGAEWLRTNKTSYTFGVRVNQQNGSPDTQAVYKYRLNTEPTSGVTAVSQTFAVTSATGPSVTNTVTVWGRDAALNWQTNGVSYRWIVDTVAPVAAFVAAPPAYTNSRALTFTVADGTDAVAWRFSVEGVTNGVTASRTFGVNVANDGAYTLSVWARDAAGNEQGSATVSNWTVDTVAPNAEFASTPPALVNSRTVSFTVKNDGDSAAWRYSVTNGSGSVVAANWITAPTTTFTVTVPSADGSYSISLFGRDRAGNERATPVVPGGVCTWKLDTQAPVGAQFVAAEMPRDPTNRTDVVAVMAADADIAEWRVSLFKLDAASNETTAVTSVTVANTNGGAAPVSAAVFSLAADGTQDGVYRLKVVGRDTAGNWQSAPLSAGIWTWTFDRTPPVAVFSQTPASPTTNIVASFVASNRLEKIVRWKYCVVTNGVDCQTWTEITNPSFSVTVPVASVTGVLYTCKLKGQDAAGNWQADANPTNGCAEWQVIKDAQGTTRLITQAFRNTVLTNGEMRVELVLVYNGANHSVFFRSGEAVKLNEQLPVTITDCKTNGTVNVNITGSQLLSPANGTRTNLVNFTFFLAQIPSNTNAKLYYAVSGVTSNNFNGTLTWKDDTTTWSLAVERGTHVSAGTNQPPADPYAVWAAQYGLPVGSETGDADGDGMRNEEEWWADTNPTNTVTPSVFSVREVSLTGGAPSQVFIHAAAGPNAILTVQKTASLTNSTWINVTPSSKVYQPVNDWLIGIDVTEPEAFFRVRAEPASAQ